MSDQINSQYEDRELTLLTDTLGYSKERNYTGYDYFDGMSSRVLQQVPIDNKWLNIAVQESIKRAPINIRPLFQVEKRQSFKGTALFLLSNISVYRLTQANIYKTEALSLAEWLVENQSEDFAGFCGGHRHAMQQLREKRRAEIPNIIPTSYAVKALLRASKYNSDYEDIALDSVTFVDEELEYREVPDGAKIKYQPLESGDYYTLNGGAICARMFIDLYEYFDVEKFRIRAEKLLDYIGKRQTKLGGWYYREPKSASHLSMDNHHNGFILESYLRYTNVTGSSRYDNIINRAINFYKYTLFEFSGAPNWDENKRYPKDIHAATQGIIIFSMLDEREFASRILGWVLDNLFAGGGQFYYQRRRFYTKRFTLMRWCQAWMAYALSLYIENATETETPKNEDI